MKLSELAKQIEDYIAENGDVEVVVYNYDYAHERHKDWFPPVKIQFWNMPDFKKFGQL